MLFFGAGRVANRLLKNMNIKKHVVAIADNNKELWGTTIAGISVVPPTEIPKIDFDKVVIAISEKVNSGATEKIRAQLAALSVPENQVMTFLEIPQYVIWGCGTMGKQLLMGYRFGLGVGMYIDMDPKLWGKMYCGIPIMPPEALKGLPVVGEIIIACAPEHQEEILEQIKELGVASNQVTFYGQFMQDHTSTARFLWMKDYARWINSQKIPGSVAECGVCAGDSAKFINDFFPDRKLYLFDTFAGFAEADIMKERSLNQPGFLEGQFNRVGHLCNPDIELVMKKMNYPEQVIIKKGFFPDSAEGVDDRFCFVNLDMDLYQPMLAALHFFWDKVMPGGCIVLHDYFNRELPGVEQAVLEFEEKVGQKLYKTILGDQCSIAILK